MRFSHMYRGVAWFVVILLIFADLFSFVPLLQLVGIRFSSIISVVSFNAAGLFLVRGLLRMARSEDRRPRNEV